jgi:Resolvase, N terminal domain
VGSGGSPRARSHCNQPGHIGKWSFRFKVAAFRRRIVSGSDRPLRPLGDETRVNPRLAVKSDQSPSGDRASAAATDRSVGRCTPAWSPSSLRDSRPDRAEPATPCLVHGELKKKNVGVYLHQQNVDSSTAADKAMLSMCDMFTAFERSIIIERVNTGLARACAQRAECSMGCWLLPQIRIEYTHYSTAVVGVKCRHQCLLPGFARQRIVAI